MLLQTFIENANLCSVPKILKSIKTNINEIQTLIVVEILNGINKLAAMRSYWSNVLRFPSIVDAMPRNCYQTLQDFYTLSIIFLTTTRIIMSRIIEAIKNEYIKIEPEEYHVVDEQEILSKMKYIKIFQYNPRKLRKWGFMGLQKTEYWQ